MIPSSMIMFMLLAVTVFTTITVGTSEAAVTCLDGSEKPVDWFVVYKLPQDSKSQTQQVKSGHAQLYMDVNNPVPTLSDTQLNATSHAIAYTLQQIYQNHEKQKIAHLMYNDQPPTGKSNQSFGHSKGVLAFDGISGFWLVHSVPRFPLPASKSYNWPDNAKRYGQTLLCITFEYDQFEKIGQQLKYNYPWVYDNTPDLVGQTPSIVDLVNNVNVTSPPWNRRLNLQSRSGQKFVSFNKAGEWKKDLYKDWLAPYFKSGLYCETWQRGRGKNLSSSCVNGLKVYNVKEVTLIGKYKFTNTKDHSKWAVTTKHDLKWICIGDINRQTTQMSRGGGAVCLENRDVHQAFFDAVTDKQKCNSVIW